MTSPAQRLFRLTFSAGLAAALGAGPLAAPAAAQAGPLGEIAQFAGQIKAQLDFLKDGLKTLDKDVLLDIKALQDEVKAGTKTPQQAHEELFARLDAMFDSQADLLSEVINTVEFNASEHLEQLAKLPNAMTVGDGGLIDGALHGAVALVHVSTAKAFGKVRNFAKKLEKQNDYDLVGDHRRQVADPMTPTEDTLVPATEPRTLLRIDMLLAGSDRSVANDGRIAVAGTADPANGANVTVTLTLPGTTPVAVVAAIDAATHRWKVIEPAALPGTLPEGNYSVDVTQGDVTISDSIGMQ